jgi:alkylation response protein AidB-like acyl-CoA dehydrogenase
VALVRTEEQEILARTAREFVVGRSPLRRVRELREDALGFSRDLWRAMAELGWLGIVVPEAYGGAGLGWTELAVVMEEAGRGLLPEPLVGSVLLATTAVLLGGSEAQKRAHLPALVAGERLAALACAEATSRYDLAHVTTRAERAGSGWKLAGEKTQVLDGHAAEWLVVSARTAGDARDADGVTLFLVPADAPGVTVERQWRVDHRPAAIVRLDGVTVAADAVLGADGQGAALLERVVDRATIGLTADMLGGMTAAFEMTLDYLKTRRQFGVPIGSFQALKHRAARLFVELELARSVVTAAAHAVDEAGTDAQVARLASVAKARTSEAYLQIGYEAVQMHGGIGMTDEHDVGLYLKRARGSELQFGDAAFHRDRVARLDGY